MIQRIRSSRGSRKLREADAGEWLVPLPGELRSMFDEALDGEKLNRSGKWCSIAFWESVKNFLDDILSTYEKVTPHNNTPCGRHDLQETFAPANVSQEYLVTISSSV